MNGALLFVFSAFAETIARGLQVSAATARILRSARLLREKAREEPDREQRKDRARERHPAEIARASPKRLPRLVAAVFADLMLFSPTTHIKFVNAYAP